MKKLFILTLALAAAPAAAQGGRPDLDSLPGLSDARMEAKADTMESQEPVQRPDASRIIAETSSALRLSSKQEERIASAVNKKTAEFDKLMKDYEKSSAEERKWRYKMNESRHAMQKIHRELPDTVREYLDDEQRQEFDELVAESRKPAPKPEAPALEEAQPADEGAAKPVMKKKRRLKKRVPNAVRGVPAGAPAVDKAALPAEEEAGQVMVDQEAGVQPMPKKRRLKKKAQPPAGAPAAPAEEPAGAKPAGKEAAAEEDAGSYP